MKIAVVGAGISGLTCAYELQKAGHDVTVYEKEAFVGGRMSSRTKDGLVFDIGANHLIDLYDEMKKYCAEFGIEWQRFPFVNYRIFRKGQLIKLDEALNFLDKIRWKLTNKKISNVPDTFLDSNTLVEFDADVTAYDYAKRYIGKNFADYILDTYTGVYQFHRADEISTAGLFSQLNSTKNHKPDWYLHRTTGGMITLPQAMADKMDIKLNTPVTCIKKVSEEIKIDTKTGTKTYDALVLATTATTAAKIYPDATEGQKKILVATKYASSIIVAYRVPKDILGDCTNDTKNTISTVWIPYLESKLLSSYSNESYKGSEMIVDKKTLLLAFMREDGADKFMNKTDEEIYHVTTNEMVKLCPIIEDRSTLVNHDIYRWQEAMPKFYPGSIRLVKNFLDSTDQGANNVWLAGDYLNAPWTEGALRSGQRVAKQIIEQYG
jgi:protoporphyrinogen/coproporphyrinogen III oxidase